MRYSRFFPGTLVALTSLAAAALVLAGVEAGAASSSRSIARSWSHEDGSSFGYVYVERGEGDDQRFMSGDGDDGDAAERLADELRGDFLYFRIDDQRWVTQDSRLLARAREAFEPVRELGRRQGEIGRRQGDVGRRQGEIGRHQGRIGRLQGEVARKQARIQLRLHGLDDDEDVRDLRRELDLLGEEMNRLNDEMAELGGRMGELGREMAPLGEEMGRLGEEMGRRSRAMHRELESLAREAVRMGTARRVD